MIGLYSVDCIAIYAGPEMNCVIRVGEDRPELKNADYALTEDFKKALDADGLALYNFTSEIPENNAFGDALRAREVFSSVHCVIGSKDDFTGVIAFHKVRTPARFADYEINCARILASSLTLINLKDLA